MTSKAELRTFYLKLGPVDLPQVQVVGLRQRNDSALAGKKQELPDQDLVLVLAAKLDTGSTRTRNKVKIILKLEFKPRCTRQLRVKKIQKLSIM